MGRPRTTARDSKHAVRLKKSRRYESRNRLKRRQKSLKWARLHPIQAAALHRRGCLRKLGLTEEDYARLYAAQKGRCAICGRKETAQLRGTEKRLAVDHCHKTQKVRGLLCQRCNQSLGLMEENIGNLAQMIEYLQRYASLS